MEPVGTPAPLKVEFRVALPGQDRVWRRFAFRIWKGNADVNVNAAGPPVCQVRRLRARFPQLSRTAAQAVGYREIMNHLDGAYDRDEAVARIGRRTRQLAKRQGTWFRSLSECRQVELTADRQPDDVAQEIMEEASPK